ncbi:MAG: alpha-L-fucosidase, partial [Sphingomonadaceae bacterium]
MTDTTWFEDARFGLFVHWGPWARAGWEASWPLVGGVVTLPLCQDIPAEAYHARSDAWQPDPAAPERWVRAAAAAGMRYAVLTARHHDGFALWPSTSAPFGVGPDGPDIVGAFMAACRKAGLRAGLYLSLSDWRHPDYPPFTDAMRPYRFGAYPMPPPEAWERYRACLRAQVSELLDRYQPDLLWFDGGWERTAAQWDADGLAAFIRARAPAILLNDRLPGHGDFATPEQFVPPEPPATPWETCLTMNRSWGFNAADHDYKTPAQLLHTLAETAARGGNLLLNIGPDGDGHVPSPQGERLEAIGGWMARNGDAILGTRAGLAAWQCPA